MKYFLAFYSKDKSILHKIKKDKSVAVIDNNFLKAYISMAIEDKETYQEVKGSWKIVALATMIFLRGSTQTIGSR